MFNNNDKNKLIYSPQMKLFAVGIRNILMVVYPENDLI